MSQALLQRKQLLRALGPVLAVCAVLLAFAGVLSTSLTLSAAADRHDHSADVQQPGVAESTDQQSDPRPTDRTAENAAEDVEALPPPHAPAQGLRRMTAIASSAARSSAGWLRIETPPPRG